MIKNKSALSSVGHTSANFFDYIWIKFLMFFLTWYGLPPYPRCGVSLNPPLPSLYLFIWADSAGPQVPRAGLHHLYGLHVPVRRIWSASPGAQRDNITNEQDEMSLAGGHPLSESDWKSDPEKRRIFACIRPNSILSISIFVTGSR